MPEQPPSRKTFVKILFFIEMRIGCRQNGSKVFYRKDRFYSTAIIQNDSTSSIIRNKKMRSPDDRDILRKLARQYAELCADPEQNRRRDLWRQQNSFQPVAPPIYIRAFAWGEMEEADANQCEDPLFRGIENFFRAQLFRARFQDDFIFEPWVTVNAIYRCTAWGVGATRQYSDEPGGSFKMEYPIRELEDLAKLRTPRHEIDEEATRRNVSRIEEAIGDLITVNLDRGPAYRMWSGDISTDLGYLRGIEHFMLDMVENPEWLHQLVGFMADGIRRTHEQAEAAGDWGLCAHQNQAMPYAKELEDPAANVNGVKRKQLWGYMAAQELTGVSPAMHEEFMLRYQRPILAEFGLVAYGCCEDLTHKIDMLRSIPNLRRIAVSPFANVARCAEQIGKDYVLSYRPSPADMVSYGFDPDRIRQILRHDLDICHRCGCQTDITLKDVQTVERDPTRIAKWVKITREVINEIF